MVADGTQKLLPTILVFTKEVMLLSETGEEGRSLKILATKALPKDFEGGKYADQASHSA